VLAGAVAAALRARGDRVVGCKPVVTGLDEPADPVWGRDHELLERAAGRAIVPHRFGPAVSPHLAAELAGVELDFDEMVAAVPSDGSEIAVVEGVGGLLVPLTATHSVRDFAVALGLPLLLAARPGLGTINHTLLTIEAARAVGLRVHAVVLTPWPDEPSTMERSNLETIDTLGRVRVATLPHITPDQLAEAGEALDI